MDTPTPLLDVAAAVADLTPVDWPALEAEAVDPVSRVALKRLRLLDRIVRACADIVPPGTATPAATADTPPATWGPFTIHERIGRGTFGDVYRAHDRRLDRIVALKLLKPGREGDEAAGAEAIHEGQLLAKVRHPNVVTVYGAERIDGRVGVWMEFIDGRTLEEELRASGPLPPDKVIDVGLALCGALSAVHDAGLLHRDLKAQNVMRASDGRLLLTDFGAGRERAEAIDEGRAELAGTPLYLAPEVLNGAPASVASEVYGLGVLLYHLATGSFPVRGRTLRDLRDAHAGGERVGIHAYRDTVPRALASVIDRSVDPDPARRFASVPELRHGLQRSRRVGRRVLAWTAAALATPFLAVAGLNLAWSMTPPLRVVGKTVVAVDAPDLGVLFSKGERLYLARREGRVFSIIPGRIDIGQERTEFDEANLADISPTGAEYLTLKPGDDNDTPELWITPPSGQPHRVGRLSCNYAAWSPDGQRIACAEGPKLLISTPDGERPRTVLSLAAGSILEPRWSPRGDILRFSLKTSSRDRPSEQLWEVRADGTGLRRLNTIRTDPPHESPGDWVLGGQYFVYPQTANGRADLWALREPRSVLDWTRPEPVRLTAGPESFGDRLAVGSDGTTVFTIGQVPRYELVRYDSSTGQFAPYVGGVSAVSVTFSPDGRSVAYIRDPERKLWRADADGGNARQIVHAPVEMNGAAWSPNNKWIAYRSRQEGENFKIFILPVDGPGGQRSISQEDKEQGVPSWSPDGDKLCYGDVPRQFGIPDGGEVLHIYDLGTGQVTDLPGSEGLYTCRWSPDGKYIAGVKIALGKQRMMLKLFDPNLGKWRELTNTLHVNEPSWSRDSTFIYYDTEGGPRAVRRVRVNDGAVEDVIKDLSGYPARQWSALSPDDAPLLSRFVGSIKLYVLELGHR